MNTTTLEVGEGQKALAVFPTATDGATDVLAALALPPHQAVLLLLGAANSLDATLVPRLTQFLGGALPARPRHRGRGARWRHPGWRDGPDGPGRG